MNERDVSIVTKINLNRLREEAKESGKGVSYVTNCFD